MMKPELVAFLRAILPSEGWYSAFILPAKRHIFTKTVEELAHVILEADAQGHTVYHACASYKEPTNRTKSNVRAVRSLWLDVDAGRGKPYADAGDAWRGCENFRNGASLPPPIYVSSGTGLHVYWPLDRELTVEEWTPYANGLKKATSAAGFNASPERTADCASILRPPGSTHRKSPLSIRMVECGGLVAPVPLALFSSFRQGTPLSVAPAQPIRRSSLASALINIYADVPTDGNRVADLCAQLARMRDTGGVQTEPDWKACLNILAFVDDGLALAHEWSAGDNRYDPAETEIKFNRGLGLSGPTTCAYFSTLNDLCRECNFKGRISSPVELGRGALQKAKDQIEVGLKFTTEEFQPDDVGDFTYLNGALIHKEEAKGGEFVNTVITQHPVYVESLTCGETKSEQHSVVLKHRPPHDEWRTVELPLRILFASGGVSEVIGRGIIVHDADLFKRFVRESIDQLNAKEKAQVQYEQFGWKDHDTTFLVGRSLYAPKSVREVSASSEVAQRGKRLGPTPGGSIEGWKNAVDSLYAIGVEAQGFAVLASFAAPLMRFQSQDEGGAVVSILSQGSGKGKTVALIGGASVWGEPLALKLANTDTKVSKGITLGTLGNMPAFYDELSNRDPEVVNEFVQIVTNGRDKQRGTGEGQLIHTANAWQTLVIAGSNKSLVDTIRAAKGSDAMTTRVMEFVVDLPNTIKHWEGEKLTDQLVKNAGWAGDAYMKALVQPDTLAYVKAALPKIREELIRKHGFTSDHRFWVRTLAAVAVAAVIVKHLGLISFSPDRIIAWATDKLVDNGKTEASANLSPMLLLATFLNNNLSNTLVMPDQWRAGAKTQLPLRTPMHHLHVRHEVLPGRLYIDQPTLRKFLTESGMSWKEFIDGVTVGGVFMGIRLVTLAAGTNIATGQSQCLVLNALHPSMGLPNEGYLREIERSEAASGIQAVGRAPAVRGK